MVPDLTEKDDTDMKKPLLITFIFLVSALCSNGQQLNAQVDATKLPAIKVHYEPEYLWDSTTDKNAWLSQKRGLNVSFGSTDRLYFRTEVPKLESNHTWLDKTWKGERLNAQL